MAKLDLVSAHAESFELHADFAMSADRMNTLFGDYGEAFQNKGLPIIFVDQYRRRKTSHAVVGLLKRFEEAGKYHLHISYQVNPDLPSARHMQSLDHMFEALAAETEPLEFSVRAAYSFPQDDFTSKLRLPVKLAPSTESSFDEIRGMRLTKFAEGDKVRYNIVVDYLAETKSIYQHLSFSYVGNVGSDTIAASYEFAQEISALFITSTGV